ncbi:transcription factor DIVARICATA-like [Nicotiana tabacum]|uniref:Transcription factor DIVARICATA-like n=2 Tax=Nicotiana TaxID=4085 RepID=A0A1S3YFH9_TOBAC|nr:PREDICTED: transcription factor DIVARICATA-like [Nicotiana sylvestris]XP_016450782.1 PREDICTED: transcription factor DIVARICATA-like [Nicotiana tabacum]
METLFPTTFMPNSNWMMQQSKSTEWTKEENKKFESALAIYDEKTPNRWSMVAAMIPGKSALDVMMQYKELVADVSDIEAGLVPTPRHFASSFTLEFVDHREIHTFRKRGKSCDQERKKGVPWTEEEHRRFLMGLEKYGKGDWRNISRNFVISKTPTQVASHAQKYYLRQLSGGKDKKRPSIHDITTVHLTVDELLNNNNNNKSMCDDTYSVSPLQKSTSTGDVLIGFWNDSNDEALMTYGSMYDSLV